MKTQKSNWRQGIGSARVQMLLCFWVAEVFASELGAASELFLNT